MDKKWKLEGTRKDRQSITADWDFTGQPLIDGVKIKEVKNVMKEGGVLTEIFRKDWALDSGKVDQVFTVALDPGGLSAWHAHEHTVDRFFVNRGKLKVVLYDSREGSPTKGQINEFRIGEHRPTLIIIPPKVWHGVMNLSSQPTHMLNLTDAAYEYEDPDHWRLPHDSPQIPYQFKKNADSLD